MSRPEIIVAISAVMFALGVWFAEEMKGIFVVRIGDDWRVLLRHAWSVRLVALASVLSGLEVVLPIIGYKLPVSDIKLATINFVIVAAAFIARFVVQEKIDGKLRRKR